GLQQVNVFARARGILPERLGLRHSHQESRLGRILGSAGCRAAVPQQPGVAGEEMLEAQVRAKVARVAPDSIFEFRSMAQKFEAMRLLSPLAGGQVEVPEIPPGLEFRRRIQFQGCPESR